MESKAKFLGHPIHQMLIVFPLGLLPVALIFDFIGLYTGNNFWYQMSFYLIAAGIIGGLMAAGFGLIDFLAIPKQTRAAKIGLMHGLGNLIVIVLFVLSWWLRYSGVNNIPNLTAMIFSILAIGLALITAWLGGELVDRLGVGVEDGANLNAPSSLSGKAVVNTGPNEGFSRK